MMSEISNITSRQTGDSCVHVKHSSGLDIYICEMPGFSSTVALFGTKYGSVNTMFRQRDDEEMTVVPEGIAHFLEHKLFENEDCKVFELYAKTGASGNAFTSFDKTVYLFKCSKNWQDSLRILLDFVQKPYFTQELVDKELGIIGQEIRMTNDDPSWRVLFNMLSCMYRSHPVKIDIAGTEESISKITAELLYKCYDTFYNLNNMVLSVAGNITAEQVLKICDELLIPCQDKGLETVFPEEPDEIIQPEIREAQPIGAQLFYYGFKCRDCSGEERLRKTLAASTAASLITDDASEMYQDLLKKHIINTTFDAEVFCGDGFFTVIFMCESDYPEEVRSAVLAEIERWKTEGIDEKAFQRIKKSTYGSLIRELNNVDAVANLMLSSHMDGVSPYEAIDMLSELTSQDVLRFAEEELREDRAVLSIIEKEGEKQ
ncbi:MAG: insulinase family protein [Ruminococcus sp.]|nr:insulinase family protein [Ruminococcus sp.]